MGKLINAKSFGDLIKMKTVSSWSLMTIKLDNFTAFYSQGAQLGSTRPMVTPMPDVTYMISLVEWTITTNICQCLALVLVSSCSYICPQTAQSPGAVAMQWSSPRSWVSQMVSYQIATKLTTQHILLNDWNRVGKRDWFALTFNYLQIIRAAKCLVRHLMMWSIS